MEELRSAETLEDLQLISDTSPGNPDHDPSIRWLRAELDVHFLP